MENRPNHTEAGSSRVPQLKLHGGFMTENEQLLRLATDLTPFDLPVGVYVVTLDGEFVQCNRRARQILQLPLDGEVKGSIADFYHDPTERKTMHEELLAAEARGVHMEKILSFEINGKEVIVQDYSRTLRDAEGNVVGHVCCMMDVTEGERSNRLLDSLPAGVYKLDANDNYETANRAFARILGYDSPHELDGKPSSDFYVDPAEAARLREMVEAKHPEPVTNFVVEMRKQDREQIFVNINAHMVKDDDGGYGGREGTIIDVTRQERYRRILRDVPVGLNVIRHVGDKDVIEDCNEQFLQLFDFPFTEPNQAKGFDARELHASPAEYNRFKSELRAAAKQGKPLSGFRLNVKTLSDEFKTIEISSQALLGPDGALIGRTGAVRDITREAELKDRLDELTYDFGSVLHNYTTTLLMVQLSSEPVIRSLAPNPFQFDREVTPDHASEAIAPLAQRVAESLAQLLDLAKEEERARALPVDKWARLAGVQGMLRHYQDEIDEVDARPAVLGEAALEAVEFCRQLSQSHRFSRETVANVRNSAQDLLRVTNLVSLHQMRDAILEMDHQVRSLREFVTTNAREPEEREVCQILELIRQVRSNLYDYARSRRIEFKVEGENAKVRIVRREVLRALTDLLHNAVKYSWRRDKTKSPWIDIRTWVADGSVYVEFKNWGVPIRQDEIEQELIFKIGYRGRHSGDRGRVGTGIGLADARRVAKAHRGSLEVTSVPSVGSWDKDDYSHPFITTVTMRLPLDQSKEGT